ncbi:MAG: 4'-phosphopantetheinyl transferase superfamily protein [Rhizobacter sp.]
MTRRELPGPAPVRLWMVALDAMPDGDAIATLSDAERQQAQRFAFEHLRRRYLAAHVGLREILAAYTGLAANELRFATGSFGKPTLVPPRCAFNMSHSDELALIAVAPQGNIGVDIERLRTVSDSLSLSQRNFTPAEHRQVADAPPDQRDLVFLRGWTRKEACLKALGSGLSIAPESFEAGADTSERQVNVPTPNGIARVQVQSLPETGGGVMALAWVLG